MNRQYSMWGDKPYYSINAYCQTHFQEKLYKIALDAGFTCPNRDGTLHNRGCIFCSAGGSGDFAVKTFSTSDSDTPKSADSLPDILYRKPIDLQIQEALALFREKKVGTRYIAYFQAFTNTYGPVSYLEEIYVQALSHPAIAGISIGTRPDCLSGECLELLSSLMERYPDKFIWVELGLQTIHSPTAEFIRRGYPLSVFECAVNNLHKRNIPVIVHVILGLPGENDLMQYETISYLNHLPIFGIKLQLLHILKGTDLAVYYENHKDSCKVLTKEQYLNLLIGCIERLSPDVVIHRVTGDGPKDLLIAPRFSLNKRDVLNSLHRQMKEQGAYQGKLYTS